MDVSSYRANAMGAIMINDPVAEFLEQAAETLRTAEDICIDADKARAAAMATARIVALKRIEDGWRTGYYRERVATASEAPTYYDGGVYVISTSRSGSIVKIGYGQDFETRVGYWEKATGKKLIILGTVLCVGRGQRDFIERRLHDHFEKYRIKRRDGWFYGITTELFHNKGELREWINAHCPLPDGITTGLKLKVSEHDPFFRVEVEGEGVTF
jgi:hypothetical protein